MLSETMKIKIQALVDDMAFKYDTSRMTPLMRYQIVEVMQVLHNSHSDGEAVVAIEYAKAMVATIHAWHKAGVRQTF